MQPENPTPSENPMPAPSSPPPVVPPAPLSTTTTSTPQEPLSQASKADSDMLEPGEHIVTVVHRHPIGIILIYLVALVGIIAVIGLMIAVAPSFTQNLSGQAYNLFIAGVIFAVGLLALILFVATYLYRQSRLIVSDKSLIQIIQRGLFIRKVSRLSMSNVQDVEAAHNGFLATVFNFGTLTVETAGEEDNFVFPFCPTPDLYADRILEARQAYVHSEEGRQGL
jgi:membrane protein YdbS with pleckstrin-like domain